MIVKKGKRLFVKRTDHALKLTDEEKKDISFTIRCYNALKPFRRLYTAIDNTPINTKTPEFLIPKEEDTYMDMQVRIEIKNGNDDRVLAQIKEILDVYAKHNKQAIINMNTESYSQEPTNFTLSHKTLGGKNNE